MDIYLEGFEKIQIESLRLRGLGRNIIKELKASGIAILGDLKGKTAVELPKSIISNDLESILRIIGIEYSIGPEYFLKYPFMSEEEGAAISEMRENPLEIPLRRIGMKTKPLNGLAMLGKKKIADVIGMSVEDLWGMRLVGQDSIDNLLEVLKRYNVTIVGGKVSYTKIKDEQQVKVTTKGEELASSPNAEEQLREFLILSREVATLSPENITRVNNAIKGILTGEKGREGDTNV